MIMQDMLARYRAILFAGSVGERSHAGKGIADVGFGQAGVWEQPQKAGQQIFNFIGCGTAVIRTVRVGHLGCADQDLSVPGENKYLAPVHGLKVDRLMGRIWGSRQHQM